MAGYALVVHGGLLLPGRELGHAVGHRPPHSSWAAEILAGLRVVDGTGGRRGDHALDGPQRFRDVEMGLAEFGDRFIGDSLHPLLEGLRSMEGAVRFFVEGAP